MKCEIQNKNYADISYGIKLGNLNVGHENDIYMFPYFCAFKLKAYLRNRGH